MNRSHCPDPSKQRGILVLATLAIVTAVSAIAQAQTPPPDMNSTAVIPSSPPPASQEVPTILSPFDVVASPDAGYLVTTAVTATKIGTAIIDTPINIQVIDSQFLADTGVTNFMNAFHYTSGVFVNDEGYFRPQGSISLRGFAPETIYRNGFPEYYNFSTDAIDSIEVVKGPSAVYFGREDPGGIINYNTKQPQFINQTSVTFTGGSDAFVKGLVDSQVVSPNKQLALRVVASAVDSGSFLDLATEKSDFALVAATWRPSSKFELKFDFEHYEVYDVGTGASGLVDNPTWVADETAIIAAGGTPSTLGQWQVQQYKSTGVLPSAYTDHWLPRGYDFNKNGDGTFEQGRTNIGDIVANWEIIPKLNLHVAFNHVVTGTDQSVFLNGDPGQLPYGPIKTNVGNESDFAPTGPVIPADNSVTSLNYGFNIFQWSMVFDRPTLPYLRNQQINQNVRNSGQGDLSYEIDGFGTKNTFVASFNYSDDVYVEPFMLVNTAAVAKSGIIPGWGFTFAGNASPFSEWISPFQVNFGTPSNGWDPIDVTTLKYSQIPNLKALDYKLSTELGKQSYWGGTNSYDKDLSASYQGAYFNDRIHVLLGVRSSVFDEVETNQTGYTNSYTVYTATTWQGGVTGTLTPGLVAYAGASQSFLPQATVNPAIENSAGKVTGGGNVLLPERGKGWDFGLKTDYDHSRWNGSLSIFDVDKYDIVEENTTLENEITASGGSLVGGSNSGHIYENGGDDRVQGVELDLVYTVSRNDQLVFDYSYYWTRAIITDAPGNINVANGGTFVPAAIDGTAIPTDTQNADRHNLAGVPPTLAGIWNKYNFSSGPLKGLTVGLGANYQSSAWTMQDAINWDIRNPSVVLVDALLGYNFTLVRIPIRAALNVNNLLDKHYQNSATGVGEPLMWKASLTATF